MRMSLASTDANIDIEIDIDIAENNVKELAGDYYMTLDDHVCVKNQYPMLLFGSSIYLSSIFLYAFGTCIISHITQLHQTLLLF